MSFAAAAILGYVFLQLAIGFVVSRRIATQADYLVAGRRLGYLLGTFTIFATWFGAETCVSSAGSALTDGVSFSSVEPFAYGFSVLVVGFLFAVPLWKRGILTLADLFRARYSAAVERFAALLMVPSSIIWAAAQVKAFGTILAVATSWDEVTATTVAAAAVIAYTAMGGLLADAVTDLVQGVVVVAGLIVLFVIVAASLGGPGAIWERIAASDRLSLLGNTNPDFWSLLEAWAIPICGSVVAQELVSRVIATRSPVVARRSAVLAGIFYIAIGTIPVALGAIGMELVSGFDPGDPDAILPRVASEYLPVALYVIFSGALVSAILSTVDSALLAAGSITSQNLLVSLRPGMSDRQKLLAARVCVIAFGVVAYVLAFSASTVYDLIEEASAFGSPGLVVILVFGLFTRFGGALAALATLAVGAAVRLVCAHVYELDQPFLISLASALVVYVALAQLGRLYRASRQT